MSLARLAYWLGPWTAGAKVPLDVVREDVPVPVVAPADRPMRTRIYRPAQRTAKGSLLLVQGLHFAGADDPRMDRFAAILASSGIVVSAPFLPDFAEMRVDLRLVRDTTRGFDMLESLPGRPEGRPGVFSISFGGMPALRLAASPTHRERVGGLVLFGGYADLADAIRFAVAGAEGRPHDPLNRPAVFLNVLDDLEGPPADRSRVAAAWHRYVRTTWGRPEMKMRERYEPVAREMARDLDPDERLLFLRGCGVEDGGIELVLAAVERAWPRLSKLDACIGVDTVVCPVHVVHGRDDDVIPFEHAERLASALPPTALAHTWLTGLYAHTGTAGLASWLGRLPALAGEVRSLGGILGAIQSVAVDRGR